MKTLVVTALCSGISSVFLLGDEDEINVQIDLEEVIKFTSTRHFASAEVSWLDDNETEIKVQSFGFLPEELHEIVKVFWGEKAGSPKVGYFWALHGKEVREGGFPHYKRFISGR